MFFILNDVDIDSYADDSTLYVFAGDINVVITCLEKSSKAFFAWFKNNFLKSNADKYHLLVSYSENASIRVDEYEARKSECKKLLGVTFNTRLTSYNHIRDICSKASRKIYSLARVSPYIGLSKRRILMNTFSILSSTTFHWFEFFPIEQQIEK